ncbi:MAG: c-type cytochrome [Candidatus Bipolaricaulia bacterium]
MSKGLGWIKGEQGQIEDILVVLGGLVAVGLLALFVLSDARLNKTYDLPEEMIAIDVPTDEASIERGRHLVTEAGLCMACHGENLGGGIDERAASLGRIVASNLTSGKGGIGNEFSDADFVRAIRHGVGPDGKPLVLMPSNYLFTLGDSDLAAIIAYLKSLPPVDNELPSTSVSLTARLFLLIGPRGEGLPAEGIDHTGPRSPAPPPGVTADYGKYLANGIGMCVACHGPDLTGVQPEPGEPPAPNLTPGSELAGWSEGDFITALRTGVTPDGHKLDGEFMPWPYYKMTDDELKAIWLYLQSLPAKEGVEHEHAE